MFLLNLSLPEFLAILGSLSGVMVALYLLDRMRKHHTVATLRFFAAAEKPPVLKHRRKLQQPWSLLLQLISLLLLLLAIAQLRLGSPARSSRDHVLILDTSAWMAARFGQTRLIDRARLAADNYVNALPPADRVMVVSRRRSRYARAALRSRTARRFISPLTATQPGVRAAESAASSRLRRASPESAGATSRRDRFCRSRPHSQRAGGAAECSREFSLDRHRRPYRTRRFAKK